MPCWPRRAAELGRHNSHSPWFPFLRILTDLPSPLITPSPSLQPASLAEARVRSPPSQWAHIFQISPQDPQLVPAQPPFPGGRNCLFHPENLQQGSCKISKAILHSQLVALGFGHCFRTMTPCMAWRGMGL